MQPKRLLVKFGRGVFLQISAPPGSRSEPPSALNVNVLQYTGGGSEHPKCFERECTAVYMYNHAHARVDRHAARVRFSVRAIHVDA